MNPQDIMDVANHLQEIQKIAEVTLDDRRLQMLEELCASILLVVSEQ